MEIILASASPRRRELLEKAGLSFRIVPAKGEEVITKTDPAEIVEELSYQKALEVQKRKAEEEPERELLVIGADTIVAMDGKVLGKPKDEEDAVKTLMSLQGRVHQVYTGVTLIWGRGSDFTDCSFHERTDVEFYPVSEEKIRAYVKSGEPVDKAGSYGIQGKWGVYVKGIHGDYNNVVGLPVPRLFYELEKRNI